MALCRDCLLNRCYPTSWTCSVIDGDMSLFLRCSYEGCDCDDLAMYDVSGSCCALCSSLSGVLLLRVRAPSTAADVLPPLGRLLEVQLLLGKL